MGSLQGMTDHFKVTTDGPKLQPCFKVTVAAAYTPPLPFCPDEVYALCLLEVAAIFSPLTIACRNGSYFQNFLP